MAPALRSHQLLHPEATTTPRLTAFRRQLRRQDALLAVLTTVFLVLRVFYTFIIRVNSDESQHLHVAWGWTQGLLPYRDFFDNHTPLFGMLCAPLLRLIGERADIITWMRLAMVPLYLAGLWCVYRISLALFARRVARWVPLLAALYPPFFVTATEFRTDALWCVLWLAALAVLVAGTAAPRRALAAGLILGAALAVSLKTLLLLAVIGLATMGTFVLRGFLEGTWPWRRHFPALAAGLAGLVVVPSLFATFFAARGAWGEMLACTIGHNDPSGLATDGTQALRRLVLPAALAVMGPGALALLRPGGGRHTRRAFGFLVVGLYAALLLGLWPTLTKQNFLPLYPLAAVFLAAAGWALTRRLGVGMGWRGPTLWWLPGLVAMLEMAIILSLHPPWISNAQGATRQIGTVLRLTDPGQLVMDAKGASVFRPRPYYPVLETFTMKSFQLGLRRDDISECMVATNTAVVIPAGLTESSQAFVNANYVPVGAGVGAAGKQLPEPAPDGEIPFEVALPDRYVLTSRGGVLVTGLLDGQPYDGQPFTFVAGWHRFRPAVTGEAPPVLLWAQAFERDLLPVANWAVKPSRPDRRATR